MAGGGDKKNRKYYFGRNYLDRNYLKKDYADRNYSERHGKYYDEYDEPEGHVDSELVRWLKDVLSPGKICSLCGRDAGHRGFSSGWVNLCGMCASTLALECCPECTAFYAPEVGHECMHLGSNMTAFAPYDGIIRLKLRQLKYSDNAGLAEIMGTLAVAAWRKRGWQADVIVPVPLYESRLKSRGFNQSMLLALIAGERLRLPIEEQALVRTRHTAAQHNLGAEARRRNVQGAFAPGAGIAAVRGKRVILLDDIITTGATMQGCADVLRTAGAAEIYCLAVAGSGRHNF